MKKIFNVILTWVIGLLIMPNLISAEVKEIGDYKYALEQYTYKDYVCDELDGKKFYAVSISNELYFYEDNSSNVYFIDITKNDNCKLLTAEEVANLHKSEMTYDYSWNEDDIVIKTSVPMLANTEFILTKDTDIVEGKQYYKFVDNMHILVEQPVKNELVNYYEMKYLENAIEYEYDQTKTYYKYDVNVQIIEVLTPTKEEYEQKLYYVESEKVETEELLNLKNIEFILPKEISGEATDYKFTKDDFLWVYEIGSKVYLEFVFDGYTYLYNTDGTIVDFGIDGGKFYFISPLSENGLFVLDLVFEDNSQVMYIMDENYNIIYQEKENENYMNYAVTIDNVDYFVIQTYGNNTDDMRILKVTKEKIVTEPIPDTFDGVGISFIVATLSLIGLVGTTIYLKRKKSL